MRHVDPKQNVPDVQLCVLSSVPVQLTILLLSQIHEGNNLNGERFIWCMAAWIIVLRPVVKENISPHGSRKKI